MLHPSTKRLIDKLAEMTRKQRVAWTEGENATVIHDTEGYRVVLTPEPHAVLLTDTLGREIESCRPEEFAEEVDAHGRPYAKFVSELYREASRHARGTEKAIRTLLAELDAVETKHAATDAAAPLMSPIGVPEGTTDETAPIETETEITAAVANLADQINAGQPANEAPAVAPAVLPEPVSQPDPEPVDVPELAVIEAEPELARPEPVAVAEAIAETPPLEEILSRPAAPPAPSFEVPSPENEPGSFGTFGKFEPGGDTEAPELVVAAEPVAEEAPPVANPPEPETASEASPEAVAETLSPADEPPASAQELPIATPTLSKPISLSSIPFGFGLGAAQRDGAPVHPSTSTPSASQPAADDANDPPKRILIDGTLDLPDFTPESLEADAEDAYPPPAPASGALDLPGDPAPPAPEPGQPRRFNPWN